MAGLIYFVPGETAVRKLEAIAAAGLRYALNDGCTPCEVTKGPDGGPGLILGDDQRVPPHKIRYYPDQQTWMKIPGRRDQGSEGSRDQGIKGGRDQETNGVGIAPPSGAPWVGYYTDEPPTPLELARVKQLPGHLVTLGDGQEYLAPVARGVSEQDDGTPVGYVALPQGVGLDGNGDWTQGDVLPRYAELWEIAGRWWDEFTGAVEDAEGSTPAGEKITAAFNFAELNDAALVALATNYHVGKAEAALLNLFDNQCVQELLNAVIDWPTMDMLIKKKQVSGGCPAPAS